MTVQRLVVGICGALFLILRMNDLSEPLTNGPGGTIGWLLFGCQLAVWVAVAVQRAFAIARAAPSQGSAGGNPIPCARLLDLTITSAFGLLLWATMFSPWTFFLPLLLLHQALVHHRAGRLAQLDMATVVASPQ